MNTSETIDITGTAELILTPAPFTSISEVKWNQDNPIGEITPMSTPNHYLFTPSKGGTVKISASVMVTIN
jgi:hypothetical protein